MRDEEETVLNCEDPSGRVWWATYNENQEGGFKRYLGVVMRTVRQRSVTLADRSVLVIERSIHDA